MKSELWQRLRAARRYADLRQLDVAKACNVSRPAVAQWEAAEEEERTRPSIKEIQALSKLAKLPVEWLLNDNADPADVWQVGRMANTPDPMPVRKTLPLPPAFESRMGEAFRRAIEFYVLQQRPDLAPGFAHQIGTVAAPFFWHDGLLADIHTGPNDLAPALGALLLAERALGEASTRKILLHLGGAADDILGIEVIPVTSPEEAAEILIRNN